LVGRDIPRPLLKFLIPVNVRNALPSPRVFFF